jgi:hypothetical protein
VAKALQCPACGNKTPLSALPDAPVFGCAQCGRSLKVPSQLRPGRAGAPSAAAARPAARTATMPAPARTAPAPTPTPRRAPTPPVGRKPVALPLRLLAWLIAIPVGLVAVVYPARELGFLSGQNLLDVIVDTGWARYWRVIAIAPLWALVTAVLVQLMVFGMRRLGDRRRRVRTERERPLDEDPRWNVSDGVAPRRRSRDRRRSRAPARE